MSAGFQVRDERKGYTLVTVAKIERDDCRFCEQSPPRKATHVVTLQAWPTWLAIGGTVEACEKHAIGGTVEACEKHAREYAQKVRELIGPGGAPTTREGR